jgi:endonuclease YncB( thermonuclease family)
MSVLSVAATASGFAWSGVVVKVTDGDSISVLHGGRPVPVRLYGVDCPEQGQDFGARAKQFTAEAVFGKVVFVDPVDMDGYGRVVAWVRVDGRSLNKELVRAGLAWWFRRYAPWEEELEALEAEAARAKVGIWSHPDPVPPWDFRRGEQFP